VADQCGVTPDSVELIAFDINVSLLFLMGDEPIGISYYGRFALLCFSISRSSIEYDIHAQKIAFQHR